MTDTNYACNVKFYTAKYMQRYKFIPKAVYRQHVKGEVVAVVN